MGTPIERLTRLLDSRNLDGALLSNPFTLTWLTGYAPPIETGPDPFLGGPALAWVHDGTIRVVASDAEAPALRALGIDVAEYAGYTVAEPLDVVHRMAQALRSVLTESGSSQRAMAIETRALPEALGAAARDAMPRARFAPADDDIAALRAVKTDAEIVKIRAALALCDVAQAHVRAVLQPGMTELDLWASMRAHVENIAGARLPMLADLVSGPRTAEIGGPPASRVLRAGDGVLFDFVPRLDGYWGDCCATWFVGEPSAELKRMRQAAHAALRAGVEAVKPGLRASELDKLLRAHVQAAGYEAYPHHSGHGVGVAYHEAPRIVPYEDMMLEAGMVIALEPGVYVPGSGGARMEDVVLVTADGCELLTQHLQDVS